MKVLVIDTSILCVWLQVPGLLTCGNDADRWDYERVNNKIRNEVENKTTLVLPLATIIETGNHISRASGDRRPFALKFSQIIRDTVNNQNPWTTFSEQTELWSDENLLKLADNFPDMAVQRVGIGDATIVDVAEYYYRARYDVEILTGDNGLKSYEPATRTPMTPRRYRK